MGFVENIIENFSAKDLKSRINGVVVTGLLICAAASVGLYLLMTSTQRISVDGVARWKTDTPNELSVSIDHSDIVKLAQTVELKAEILSPPDGRLSLHCEITAIEPNPPAAQLVCEDLPERLREFEKMDTTLVIFDRPLWQMLWTPKR